MPEISRFDVEIWIATVATGKFHYKSVCGLQGRLDPKSDNKLRGIIWELCKKGVCESVGGRDGWYRPIDKLPDPEDWQNTDATKDFPIVLPFDLRKYVWIDPGTTIVVAGSKDSGKTGFLMRTVVLNMNRLNTVFLCNMEGGKNQLKRRFGAMDIKIPNPPPFKTWVKTENFHDYMKEPNTLYVIDYIDVPESGEYFMIPQAIARIQTKLLELGRSVAVVGLQKRGSSDIAYGGELTLKKTSLYIALNPGRLKIVSAKLHANPKIDPKNMQWTFKYEEEGTKFSQITPYYGGD